MKALYFIILILFTTTINSKSDWNQVFKFTGTMMQWDLDCADSLNCISVGNNVFGMVNVRTTDGGYNWFVQYADTQKTIYNDHGQVIDVIPTKFKGSRCIDFVTPYFVVIGHLEGQIAISRDGGVNWDSVQLNTNQDLKIIRFTDSLTGIALTNNLIFLTTDGGVSWNNITSNLNYSYAIFFQSAFMKGNYIYAGDFFSTDKGNTWTRSNQHSLIGGGMYGVYFIDSLKGWCAGREQVQPNSSIYSHTILQTIDGGKNWIMQMDTSINNIGLVGGIFFKDENHGLAWGNNTVWLTSNGGKNWFRDTKTNPIVNNRFNRMVFPNKNFTKRIANTEMAGSIWLYDDLTSVNENEINENNINIFPNPSSDFITIQFQTSEGFKPSEVYKVQIFDMLGIEIISEAFQPMTASHRINVEKLPAGVYFIRLGNKVEKFVKM